MRLAKIFRMPVVCAAICGLSGCAQVPSVMHYYPEGDPAVQDKILWPALPEVPRYRYAGQLQGENNFKPADRSGPGAMEKLVKLLVGVYDTANEERMLSRPQTGAIDNQGRIYVTDVGRNAIFVFDVVAAKLHIWDQADRKQVFVTPIGIAMTPAGEILVSDAELGRIIRLDRTGNPLGSFGAAELKRPSGLAVDANTGKIYVADSAAHVIKVFTRDGVLAETIGRAGIEAGEFNGPTHLVFANQKLYVSDTLNARVQILTSTGDPVSIIGRRGLYVGNLVRPKGISVDDEGNIYVVEGYYDYLLVFDAEGRLLLPLGGTGRSIGRFFLPTGVWIDSKNHIYVSDMLNSRIQIMQYLGGDH